MFCHLRRAAERQRVQVILPHSPHPLATYVPPRPFVRGVNVMRVVDGKIVEAAGYSKTAPTVAALED